jgi:glutathione S-transferase
MSTASITMFVLEELDVPCERIRVDLRAGGTKTPEFLALNPNGKVPVIVHEGTSIWESAAITMYLGETFGVERNLYPAPGPSRGEAMKWIAWSAATLVEAVVRYARNTTDWSPKEQRNALAGEAALADVHACLKIVDHHLRDRDYLVGAYTLADTHLQSLTEWLQHMQIDFKPYERLNAWGQRVATRPAHARAQARESA